MKSQQQQQELLEHCVSQLSMHLMTLVGRFGGKKLEQEFKEFFSIQAANLGLEFKVENELNTHNSAFMVHSSSTDWTRYRK